MSDCAVVATPVGRIKLRAGEDENGVPVLAEVKLDVEEEATPPKTPLLKETAKQLERYFAGELKEFDLPLAKREDATPFQHSVWVEMQRIPYGEVRTYGEVAKALATSPRPVGGACGSNPLPIIVPCHRIVAKNGLGGFSGEWEGRLTVTIKKRLLELEGAI